MSFRLVAKSVTLNDLERCNVRNFALFQRIRVPSGRTTYKFTFAISSPDEFLSAKVNYAVARPSVVCRLSVCLSVCVCRL